MGHRRQRLVVDDDKFGGVLGRGDAGGDDDGDDLAHLARGVGRHAEMRRVVGFRAVRVGQKDFRRMVRPDRMRNGVQAVRQHVRPGQHREHAGCGARHAGVDRADQRVRMWRAQHDRIGLPGQVQVVAVAPAAGEQAEVLSSANRRPNAGLGGVSDHCTSCTAVACWRYCSSFPL